MPKERKPVRRLLDVFPKTEFKYAAVPRVGVCQHAPGQDEFGYGRAIHTDYKAKFDKRWQRVYCCCISNVSSIYVMYRGEWLFIRDYDIPDEVKTRRGCGAAEKHLTQDGVS